MNFDGFHATQVEESDNHALFFECKRRHIQSAVGRGRAGRPDHDQQHCYHQAPTVNQKLLLQL
jgi:hypothetical protein